MTALDVSEAPASKDVADWRGVVSLMTWRFSSSDATTISRDEWTTVLQKLHDSLPDNVANPVAWRRLIDSPYEQHPRYVYAEEEIKGGEPLYARSPQAPPSSKERTLLSRAQAMLHYMSTDEARRALAREIGEYLSAPVETTCARCKEHEQFRHQHRDCDRLAVALQRIKLGPPLTMNNDEVAAWAASIASEAFTEKAPADPFASKYHELLLAVERKFPDESRHATALRYIREAEGRANEGGPAQQVKTEGSQP